MTLHTWHLQPYAMTVVDAAMITKPEMYDLDPPYQRGLVWTDEQRVNLIRSLIEGIPVGIVYRNFRGWGREKPYVIVDGKQRIDTIRRFYAGRLLVPAIWFPDASLHRNLPRANEHEALVTYLGLSDQGQRIFDMSGLAIYETRVSAAMEEVLYERVNYGGTPHEARDITAAQ